VARRTADLPASLARPDQYRRPSRLQRSIRQILIETRGQASVREIAEILQCSPASVYRALQQIHSRAPLHRDPFVPAREVKASLKFWDHLEQRLVEDLEQIDALIDRHGMSPSGIGFHNVRLGLLAQLQTCRVNRTRFSLDIGLLVDVSREMVPRGRTLADLEPGQVYEELAIIDAEIEELSRGLPALASAGAQTQAALAGAEGEDQLQGTGPGEAG
jgi:DNA-binding CsgD family transcriptional regulator